MRHDENRLTIAEVAIRHSRGVGLVIIDGIRDLLYDINSPSEATNTVTKLMKWTDENRLHIHTIIHQNKSDENAVYCVVWGWLYAVHGWPLCHACRLAMWQNGKAVDERLSCASNPSRMLGLPSVQLYLYSIA